MTNVQGLTEDQLSIVAELEIEMMSDMYHRMTNGCFKKCLPLRFKDADLTKGESVCVDRCVAKYLEVHDRIGKKLTSMSMQDEQAMKQIQAAGVSK
ncbi:putative Mitochondrial import inner membrane translocase subunit Tim10 [Hypsibius exemplaris]|uniref:Mitochondrial import inner membrane translocase subunit n=1 Tax=Hypsibius exemplaris TaxID=2072580 RepID=A0A1W0XD40_HYPEX|nr:putative Mitochondrial import inner membrane translocase subunit Tim10 [Hypsibius exemplaris]